MCTASWQFDDAGYTLFFNRDERVTRPEGERPERYRSRFDGIEWLAPLDPEGGGTWAFVNSRGLSAVILNNYRDTGPVRNAAATPRSRGRLLLDLAPAANVDVFTRSLEFAIRLERYRPFLLLAIDVESGPVLHRWTGVDLNLRLPIYLPLVTTSSFQTDTIERERSNAYRSRVADPDFPRLEELDHLHRWHDARNTARSILMSRTDARTVSRTNITVRSGHIEMTYQTVRPETPPSFNSPLVARLLQKTPGLR